MTIRFINSSNSVTEEIILLYAGFSFNFSLKSRGQSKNESKDIEKARLIIKEIRVDSAGMLKRLRTAPQGRAHRIRKRSNHVTIVLESNELELK